MTRKLAPGAALAAALLFSANFAAAQTGACCFSDGECLELDAPTCGGLGGAYGGDGTTCSPNPCAFTPIGGCCVPDGFCYDVSADDCAALGGAYQGDGVFCVSVTCAAPPGGACCFVDGSCAEDTAEACAALGGAYQGDGSDCAGAACSSSLGACCFPENLCLPLLETDCLDAGGAFSGVGTDCSTACISPDDIFLADTNCDGVIDNGDIDSFVQALMDPDMYLDLYPGCDPLSADMNGDSEVDNADIDGFVLCLIEHAGALASSAPCGSTSRAVYRCPALPRVDSPAAAGTFAVGWIEDIIYPNAIRPGTAPPGTPGAPVYPGIPNAVFRADQLGDDWTGIDALPGVDIRAQVRYPATRRGLNAPVAGAATATYPLVVIVHGNHGPYSGVVNDFGAPDIPRGRPRRRVDPRDENYRGYSYLQDLLATQGYISISIGLDDFAVNQIGMLSRGWVVLCHIENMERANGLAGHLLQNHVDLSRTILIGHSRGGEAIVRAERMNSWLQTEPNQPAVAPNPAEDHDDPRVIGPAVGPGAGEGRFALAGVFSLAATRFFDGTTAFGGVRTYESKLRTPLPFAGMWGDADGDVSGPGPGAITSSSAAIYDRSHDRPNSGPVHFVWMEGANHNFWNTSWFRNDGDGATNNFGVGDFGDDGYDFANTRDRVSRAGGLPPRPSGTRGDNDEIQQDVFTTYVTAFVRGYTRPATEDQFLDYFRRPPTDVGLTGVRASQRPFLHLQHREPVGAANRLVAAEFEDAAPLAPITSDPSVTVEVDGVNTGLIGANDAASDTQSFYHATKGLLFDWVPPAVGDSFIDVEPVAPATSFDVFRYRVLSFRVTQDRRGRPAGGGHPAAPSDAPLVLHVTLTDGRGRSATVDSTVATNIPVHQTRTDDALLTKSMLKTLRIPLCEFRNEARRNGRILNLRDIRSIRFEFGRGSGKAALDDIEFSN